MNGEPSEHEQLRRVIGIMLLTSIPMLAFSVYIGVTSGSLSVITVVLDSVVALLLQAATFLVLGIVSRGNVFQFPYGTGKLENATSVFHGCGMLLVGCSMLYQSILRLADPPATVSLGLAQLAIVVGIARMSLIMTWLQRMARKHPERSPLLHVNYVSYKAGLWCSSGLLLAMLIGWLLSYRFGNAFEFVADLLIAALYSVVLVSNGIRVIRANFRALLDLPLPEEDQLKILRVLGGHFDDYANLVNVLTRFSGGQRRIELELAFAPDTTTAQVEALRSQMRAELSRHFERLEFQLIARCPDS